VHEIGLILLCHISC